MVAAIGSLAGCEQQRDFEEFHVYNIFFIYHIKSSFEYESFGVWTGTQAVSKQGGKVAEAKELEGQLTRARELERKRNLNKA